MDHLSDTDLERYYLGMIPDGPELAALEEHLLISGECVDRAEEAAHYVDMIRAWIIERIGIGTPRTQKFPMPLVTRKVPPGAAAPECPPGRQFFQRLERLEARLRARIREPADSVR